MSRVAANLLRVSANFETPNIVCHQYYYTLTTNLSAVPLEHGP